MISVHKATFELLSGLFEFIIVLHLLFLLKLLYHEGSDDISPINYILGFAIFLKCLSSFSVAKFWWIDKLLEN